MLDVVDVSDAAGGVSDDDASLLAGASWTTGCWAGTAWKVETGGWLAGGGGLALAPLGGGLGLAPPVGGLAGGTVVGATAARTGGTVTAVPDASPDPRWPDGETRAAEGTGLVGSAPRPSDTRPATTRAPPTTAA